MNALHGYQFCLPILISAFTTFAQFTNFEAVGSAKNTLDIAEHPQKYYPFIPYWRIADNAKINDIDIRPDQMRKGIAARERHYSTVRRSNSGKRIAFSEANSNASIVRRYDASTNIHGSNDYHRQSAFRLLALNGARGFGK